MASFRRTGKADSFCCSRSHRGWNESSLCTCASQDRHFCHGNQKESCLRPVDSLFRTKSSRRNHSAPKTLPGASEITAEKLAKTCAELASNKKAEEIVVLDLRSISTFTDFFVICSATSEPQLKAIANEIETRLKKDHAIRSVAIDGFPASQWIVLDYLQVVVHVFHRDKRAFYSLEDLWGDAPRLDWEAAAIMR
jgi:ribosome-associated protein